MRIHGVPILSQLKITLQVFSPFTVAGGKDGSRHHMRYDGPEFPYPLPY